MEEIKKESIYFAIQNIVFHYWDLEKEDIMPTLKSDILYLKENNLTEEYRSAYMFLKDLSFFLGTDGTDKTAYLDSIPVSSEVDLFDVFKQIYKKYHSQEDNDKY